MKVFYTAIFNFIFTDDYFDIYMYGCWFVDQK